MGARSEREPRLDDDRDYARGNVHPRRADPERTDTNAAMELAPALLPAWFDWLDDNVGKRCPQPRFSG